MSCNTSNINSKIKNFLWIDLVSSDAQRKETGMVGFTVMIDAYYDIVDSVANAFSLKILDNLGDGMSIYAPNGKVEDLINAFSEIQLQLRETIGLTVKGGIHSGGAIIRNRFLSSGKEVTYVVGAISEAYRLEQLCKKENVRLIISSDAYDQLKDIEIAAMFKRKSKDLFVKNTHFPVIYKGLFF